MKAQPATPKAPGRGTGESGATLASDQAILLVWLKVVSLSVAWQRVEIGPMTARPASSRIQKSISANEASQNALKEDFQSFWSGA